MSEISIYKSFEARYLGDRAGVVLSLTKPITSTETMPKDEFNRVAYDVITVNNSYSWESLAERIKLAEVSDNAATLDILMQAQKSLKSFISENGLTNPREAVDWVDDSFLFNQHSSEPALV